jgi:hypothetical protein
MNQTENETLISASGLLYQTLTTDPDWNKGVTVQDVILRAIFFVQYLVIFPIIAVCLFYVRNWMRKQGLFMTAKELDSYMENGAEEKPNRGSLSNFVRLA